MKDRPIQVGDLVQVVRGFLCCGWWGPKSGRTFIVDRIGVRKGRCPECGQYREDVMAVPKDGFVGYAIGRLKRFPPLEELEGQQSQEDMKEPA